MGLDTIKCNVCGAEVDKDTTTCPYCGCMVQGDGSSNVVYTSEETGSESGVETEEASSSFDYVKTFKRNASMAIADDSTDLKKDRARYSWANFLRAILAFSILRYVYGLSNLLTGTVYKDNGTTAEDMYAFYGNSLKYLDIFYELMLVLAIILAVMAFSAINKLKSTAGFLVTAVYAVSLVSGIVLIGGRTLIFGVNNFDRTTVASMCFAVIMMTVNIIFFKKSKHIFVN